MASVASIFPIRTSCRLIHDLMDLTTKYCYGGKCLNSDSFPLAGLPDHDKSH